MRQRSSAAGYALASALVALGVSPIASETLTLTTYYPSPLGVYREIITTGTKGANTILVRDAGDVGIGTSNPSSLLHIVGRPNATISDTALMVWGQGPESGIVSNNNSTINYAVAGWNGGTGGAISGGSAKGIGISGYSNGSGQSAVGVGGEVGGTGVPGNAGVYGASLIGGNGVIGESDGNNSVGVRGEEGNGKKGTNSTGLLGLSWSNNSSAVYAQSSGNNSVAVVGLNQSPNSQGWSGYFSGGQGLLADKYYSMQNIIPIDINTVPFQEGSWAFAVRKPTCPSGPLPTDNWVPNIKIFYVGNWTGTGYSMSAGDYQGAAVWDNGDGTWGTWGGYCQQQSCTANGVITCGGSFPWFAAVSANMPGAITYITFCGPPGSRPFHDYPCIQ